MSQSTYVGLVIVLMGLVGASLWLTWWFWARAGDLATEAEAALPPPPPAPPTKLERREIRDTVMRHTVVLSLELARVDGFLSPKEMDAIQDFIVTHVKRGDSTFAARIMREALELEVGAHVVDEAIRAIGEVADPDQVELVLEFLVFVGGVDGMVVAEEVQFIQRVARGLGVPDEAVRAAISATAS